ncbi:hypothetical protein CTEN210_09912 [Chaetoceros tenuissimus]|uniref:DUF6824 domain-containing protein n=1 Tax=Chaetoceros tenuissimus TaxID=426638 RepID=A0AAD3CYE6_9STRA|nr:hypothetical protein CTEN210_09912 [Chaetoceros tenuissimus]
MASAIREDIPPAHGGPIKDPNVNDVLSGRGGRINSHPGNVQFRALVAQNKHTYLSKQTKKLDKVKIADKIVQAIRNMDPPGRFLKEESGGTQMWIEIGDEKARKKAGQAMREKADETRKELEQKEILSPNNQMNFNGQNSQQMGQMYNGNQAQNQVYGNQFASNGSFPAMQNSGQFGSFSSPQQFSGSMPQFSTSFSNMDPDEARRQQAEIMKGNAVAFDREFHKLRGSDSSTSRVHSLATSGVSSMRGSGTSNSSVMSMLSSGMLSQNELLQLALMQQQSGQMASVPEKLDWSDRWDHTNNSQSMASQNVPNNNNFTVSSGTSVRSGMTDSDKRRMFQQNRDKSHTYIPDEMNLKGGNAGGQNDNMHASQLMKDSLLSMGPSGTMEAPAMSSMGMGSTNMMSMSGPNDLNVGNNNTQPTQDDDVAKINEEVRARVENMQRRLSGIGLDPLLVSDSSLMNMLAEAAVNSESIGSTFSFKSSMGPDTFAGATHNNNSISSLPPVDEAKHMNPIIHDNHAQMGNMNQINANGQPPSNIPHANVPGGVGSGVPHENYHQASPSHNLDPNLNLNYSQAPTEVQSQSMRMQPPRNVQRFDQSHAKQDGYTGKDNRIFPGERGVYPVQEGQAYRSVDTNQGYQQTVPGVTWKVQDNISPLGNEGPPNGANFKTESDPSSLGDSGHNERPGPTRPPPRGFSRAMSGLSTKSDVSMGSTDWTKEIRNLSSLRNNPENESRRSMGDRLRLFSENSTRSLMSDLSDNMSALDLSGFDTGSRRDLFGSFRQQSSRRGFGLSDADMGGSRRDLGK